jgi:hypothetical protein
MTLVKDSLKKIKLEKGLKYGAQVVLGRLFCIIVLKMM